MKWQSVDFKNVQKQTKSQLSLTHHANSPTAAVEQNKNIKWSESTWNQSDRFYSFIYYLGIVLPSVCVCVCACACVHVFVCFVVIASWFSFILWRSNCNYGLLSEINITIMMMTTAMMIYRTHNFTKYLWLYLGFTKFQNAATKWVIHDRQPTNTLCKHITSNEKTVVITGTAVRPFQKNQQENGNFDPPVKSYPRKISF